MSSMYIVEPPTSGKVVLTTDCGDVDIELWCKECPKACRNFIQLCQEGYYDGTLFHRVLKGFMVQGGDPTNTGEGGESIWGRPFKDEFHQRLKFTHRGQVAMANGGPNDNGSQFFITLDKCEHLNRKNTIFGKVTGNTIFNVLQMGERPVDGDDRPEEPIRIRKTETLSCPFDDIVPRELKKKVSTDDGESRKRKRKVKAIKNFSLISFGDEAEEDEVETNEVHAVVGSVQSSFVVDSARSKHAAATTDKSSPDAAPRAAESERMEVERERGDGAAVKVPPKKHARKTSTTDGDSDGGGYDAHMRSKALASKLGNVQQSKLPAEEAPELSTREGRIEASKREAKLLQEQLRTDRKRREEPDESEKRNISARSDAQKFLDEQARKYESNRDILKSKERRQDQTIQLLSKFKSKLSASIASRMPDDDDEEEIPSDDDSGWMGHKLEDPDFNKFDTVGIDPALDPNTLSIVDPRNPLNKRRLEEGKKKLKHRDRRR